MRAVEKHWQRSTAVLGRARTHGTCYGMERSWRNTEAFSDKLAEIVSRLAYILGDISDLGADMSLGT